MNPYQINEGGMLIPPSWQDQSLNIFRIPANDKAKEASLLISRDASQGEGGFADFISAQMKQCAQNLPGFKQLIASNRIRMPGLITPGKRKRAR